MYRYRYRMLIEIALFAALALVLDIFTHPLKIGPWISLSFKMLPIFIVALRWGPKAGMMSGLLWGLLQIASGQASGGILTPLQAFIEYFLAFTAIGVSGVFKSVIDKAAASHHKFKVIIYMILSVMLGSFCRYFYHFIAGIIFWGQYAPKNISPIYYSAIINSGSWLGETLSCIIILLFIQSFLFKFLKTH